MTTQAKRVVIIPGPEGPRAIQFGTVVATQDPKGGLVVKTGPYLSMSEVACWLWCVFESEDRKYPHGQGRQWFAGYIKEICDADIIQMMQIVARIEDTLPEKDDGLGTG